jgi:hypothetical protein
MEPFAALLDQWIEDNKKLRPKQRQQAKRMHQRLCDEYGFIGHYTTVQRYYDHLSYVPVGMDAQAIAG